MEIYKPSDKWLSCYTHGGGSSGFLLERRHVLRPWTGTRGVAEGAARPIDYLHPFLNQMLDYENKGLVRNESPEEKKGWEEGDLVACRACLCLLSKTPRRHPAKGAWNSQPRVVAQVRNKIHLYYNEILSNEYILLLFFFFFLIYISRNIKIRKHDWFVLFPASLENIVSLDRIVETNLVKAMHNNNCGA